MSSAIDGLVSGLDTTTLIASLMKLEAQPKTNLQTKQTNTENRIAALQSLNVKIASLATVATTAATSSSWSVWSATSTATNATATTTSTAQAGSITFSVDAVAKRQVSLTNVIVDNGSLVSGSPPNLTIQAADGSLVTVAPTSGSLADIAAAINATADTGVHASVIQVSGGATPQYRLQVSASSTGTEGAFKVFSGSSAEVQAAIDAGTESDLRLDGNLATAASNATITLWKGSAGLEQSFTQSSNTFTGLMTGVDVTVSAVTAAGADPTTVTVDRDAAAVTKLAADLVASIGVSLSEIATRSKTTTSTASDGGSKVVGGLFSGDALVRGLQQGLTAAMASPVNGLSPAEVGITINRDGTFTFDTEKFATALAADPTKVQSMITTIADRVATVAGDASNATTGTLTQKITGQQSVVKDLGGQIDSWDARLALRRTALEKTYAALEVSLSNLNSQSSWLTAQLDALTSSTS